MTPQTAVLAMAVVVGLALVPMGTAVAGETAAAVFALDDGNETNATPGERLSGTVGVQQAEYDAEIEERSFDHRFETAESDAERAALVSERLDDAEGRLEELEERADRLEEKRENGTISEGQYRALMAELEAERRAVERSVNRSAEAAEHVPTDHLAEHGVNASKIGTLREQADELAGPEVAEIAREIGGPDVGEPTGDLELPDRSGPPENGTETGPPDDTETGPPDDDAGPPGDDTGPANGGGPPDDPGGGQGPPDDVPSIDPID